MKDKKNQKTPNGNIISIADIGALLRQARKKTNITQSKAAGLSGVGVRFFSELERGKPTLEIGKVLQVLKSFGFEISIQPRGKK